MKYYCNKCGRELDHWDLQENLRIHNPKLGYGSENDGDGVDLRLCCKCFDELVKSCVINPLRQGKSFFFDSDWDDEDSKKSGLLDDDDG